VSRQYLNILLVAIVHVMVTVLLAFETRAEAMHHADIVSTESSP
jgi:hypothetical protein